MGKRLVKIHYYLNYFTKFATQINKKNNYFMKKLLLLITVLGSFTFSYAQLSCATATTITANGTITTSAIPASGTTYQLACDQTNGELAAPATPQGIWYKFTAASNGTVAITSSIPPNTQAQDTRLSVYSGTCAALTCVAGNDDISATDYLSAVNFNAISGTTYYIQWDNRWASASFAFSFTFTAVSCLPVTTVNAPSNIATTSMTLNWATATGNPAEYQVEYGVLGFLQGTGTVVTVSTNSANLTGLTASTAYDYYVRSKCNSTDFSAWTTVNSFSTAKVCPQTFGFETNAELVGFSTFGNGAYGLSANAPTNAQAGNYYWIFNTNATTVSNNWLFTPAFSLQANEQVTVTFWIRCATARSLRFTVGNAATSAAQTTQLWANNALNNPTYTQFTATYTAPSAGIYYFGWNDISTAQATATLRLDSINFTSVLSNNEYLASNLSVYPNPTKNIINISNSLNAVVENVVLTDLNGRVVKRQNIDAAEGQVNISDLATGIYMMNVTTNQGTATKKVIKE